jgi:hypothetical protein
MFRPQDRPHRARHCAPAAAPRDGHIELHLSQDRHHVRSAKAQIQFEDLPWLRRACSKSGAEGVPAAIAKKLVDAGLVQPDANRSALRITEKGRIALSKLG